MSQEMSQETSQETSQESRSQDLQNSRPCPDCDGVSRRSFLLGVGTAAAAAAAGALPVFAAPRSSAASDPETAVAQLYKTMTDEQKKAVCFGWEHPRRLMISNNWHIVPQKIGQFYTPEQQEIAMEIFRGAHSEEWVPKKLKQMKDDSGQEGLKDYSMAIFGHPGTDKFEWVMTGRHLTLRVDGHSEKGTAFGGPIFYGHAAQGFNEKADHPGNVYWYQAQQANEVFKALDGKQQAKALLKADIPPDDSRILVPQSKEHRRGLAVAEMSRDQKALVAKVLDDLLAPMRKSDVADARHYLTENGGLDSLNMSFYEKDDIGNDHVWDVWMLEGPSMVWYFRGAPHVHTWVYIAEKPRPTAFPGPKEG